ncbi:hypothetical protein [Insolitispirillum peregrinum]|uniref:hypothetical protein n=1 Tax=Insolitispirillum peregrinum TaxID=80876 RepID=UPI0036164CC3
MNSPWLWIGLALTLLVIVLSFGSLTFSLPDPPAATGTSLSRDVGMALQGLGVSTPALTGVMADALHTLKEGVIR